MTEYQLLMLRSLREEIAFFNESQLVLVVMITTLSLCLYVVAHHERFSRTALAIPFLISSGLVALGRTDLLMHRAGAYLKAIDVAQEASSSAVPGWELFKSQLPSTRALPVYDILALGIWFFLLVWSERVAWSVISEKKRGMYVAATLVLIAVGILSIMHGASTA